MSRSTEGEVFSRIGRALKGIGAWAVALVLFVIIVPLGIFVMGTIGYAIGWIVVVACTIAVIGTALSVVVGAVPPSIRRLWLRPMGYEILRCPECSEWGDKVSIEVVERIEQQGGQHDDALEEESLVCAECGYMWGRRVDLFPTQIDGLFLEGDEEF